MAKTKPQFRIKSYGLYTLFEKGSKDLPQVLEFTEDIPAVIGNEFGYILEIRKGKGIKIDWKIEHPVFNDSKGRPAGVFVGEFYVKSNEYLYFLGDTFWEPVGAMKGKWEISCYWDKKEIARKVFNVI